MLAEQCSGRCGSDQVDCRMAKVWGLLLQEKRGMTKATEGRSVARCQVAGREKVW